MRSFTRPKNPGKRHGAILVATLGLIILMTFLVMELLSLSTAEVKRLSLQADKDELRTYAYSCLEITLGVLMEIQELDSALRSPSQGWGTPLVYAEELTFPEDIKASVIVEDETGKIPLSIDTDPRLLNAFFEKLGFDSSQASTFTDSLLDWMDPDDNARLNGAESSYYDRKNPPYKPPGQPITNFTELLYIQGFDEYLYNEDGTIDERFENLKANATLDATGPINLNTAPPLVLEVLKDEYGLDPSTLLERRKQFEEGSISIKDALIASSKDLNTTVEKAPSKNPYGFDSKTLKARIEVGHGDNRFLLNCILQSSATNNTSSPASKPSPNAALTTKSRNFTIVRLVENAPLD